MLVSQLTLIYSSFFLERDSRHLASICSMASMFSSKTTGEARPPNKPEEEESLERTLDEEKLALPSVSKGLEEGGVGLGASWAVGPSPALGVERPDDQDSTTAGGFTMRFCSKSSTTIGPISLTIRFTCSLKDDLTCRRM